MNKSDISNEISTQSPAQAGSAIIRGLRTTDAGLLCAVQWSDTAAGRAGIRVAQVQPDGTEESVFDHSGEGLEEGNATLFGLCDTALKMVVINGLDETRFEAIDPVFKDAAAALSDASRGYVSAIASNDHTVAVLDEYIADEELCQRVIYAGADGAVSDVDLASLELQEGRMISGLVFWGDQLGLLVADMRAGAAVAVVDLAGKDKTPQVRLQRGAHRFTLNAAISAACATPEGLLMGTAAMNNSSRMLGNWGAEVILLMSENWDLLVGQPRFSPDGLKVPASMQGPGFDKAVNCAVQAIAEYTDGDDRRIYMVVQEFDGEFMDDRLAIIPDFREYRGTARLFVSADMDEWSEIEMALPEDCGAITSLAATSTGVVIGHEGVGADGAPMTQLAVD